MDQAKKMGLGAWEEISDSVRIHSPLPSRQLFLSTYVASPFFCVVCVCLSHGASTPGPSGPYHGIPWYTFLVKMGSCEHFLSTRKSQLASGGKVPTKEDGQAVDSRHTRTVRYTDKPVWPPCRTFPYSHSVRPLCFVLCIGRRAQIWLNRTGRCPRRSFVKPTVTAVSVSCLYRGGVGRKTNNEPKVAFGPLAWGGYFLRRSCFPECLVDSLEQHLTT